MDESEEMLSLKDTILVGQWSYQDGKMIEDDVCRRIRMLVRYRLKKIANDSSGWRTLYRDPTDDRLWELTYPQSALQVGGHQNYE